MGQPLGGPRDTVCHSAEDERVGVRDALPVHVARETLWQEQRPLLVSAGGTVRYRAHLQPRATRQQHLGAQSQQPASFDLLDPPEVHRLADPAADAGPAGHGVGPPPTSRSSQPRADQASGNEYPQVPLIPSMTDHNTSTGAATSRWRLSRYLLPPDQAGSVGMGSAGAPVQADVDQRVSTSAFPTFANASRTAKSKPTSPLGGSAMYRAMSCSLRHCLVDEALDQWSRDPAGTGVTSPTHKADSRGVSGRTGRIRRRGSFAMRAYRRIISWYVNTSGPPMSNARCTRSGTSAHSTRYRRTSPIAIGWMRLRTQRGVTIAGSLSVRYRSISNDADPEPMMTAARRTTVGTPAPARIRPTSARERKCGDACPCLGTGPPR